jgi:hypothetical protein
LRGRHASVRFRLESKIPPSILERSIRW